MSEETKESQNDEREALISIYEGDNAFKQVNPTTFLYKYGEEGNNHSFLVELKWGENYPNDVPTINLNVFYNQHLVKSVKEKISKVLNAEAEQWLGCGMTYTLFECLKERVDELMEHQPSGSQVCVALESGDDDDDNNDDDDDDDGGGGGGGDDDGETGSDDSDESDESDADVSKLSLDAKKPVKKEQLTKAQKRRQWDQAMVGGEKPRGWNWADIVKHLSQCGNKDEAGAIPQNYEG